MEQVGLASRHAPQDPMNCRADSASALPWRRALVTRAEHTAGRRTHRQPGLAARPDEILELFDELHQAGNTIVLVTHDRKVGEHAERVVRMLDGQRRVGHQEVKR